VGRIEHFKNAVSTPSAPSENPREWVWGELPAREFSLLSGLLLTSLDPGDEAVITHLEDEQFELSDRLLHAGLSPGMRLRMIEPVDGSVRIQAGGRVLHLDTLAAGNVTFEPRPTDARVICELPRPPRDGRTRVRLSPLDGVEEEAIQPASFARGSTREEGGCGGCGRSGAGFGRVRWADRPGRSRDERAGQWVDHRKLGLRRIPSRAHRRGVLRDAQVPEDRAHDAGVGQNGEDAHLTVAGGTPWRIHLVDAGEQLRPATARAAVAPVAAQGDERVGSHSLVRFGATSVGVRVLTPVAGGLSSPRRVRGGDAVIAVPVDTRRRNQACETVEQLERTGPDQLQSRVITEAAAGGLLAPSQATGVAGTVVVPICAGRVRDQRRIVRALAVLEAVGWAGLLVPGLGIEAFWVGLLGFILGGTFGLALTPLVLRSADAESAGELSGMAQSVGYTVVAAGPPIFGWLYDVSGGWTVPLWFLVAVLAGKLAAGLPAGRSAELEAC